MRNPFPRESARQICGLAKLLLLFVLLLGVGATASAAGFQAALDRDNISVGESATLSLVFQDGQPESEPQVPGVANLRIQYVGPSSSISIINGRQSSTFTYNYVVMAMKEGDYVIPSVKAVVNGRAFSSQPLRLKVEKVNTTLAQATGGPMLKLILPKTNICVGEPVPIEIRLYATEGRLSQPPQLQADGFTIGKVVQGAQSKTALNGREYNVLVFKAAITAVRPGSFQLGPATMPIAVPQAGRQRDPFEAFFGGQQFQQVNLTSDAATINVLSVPGQNVPSTYTGGIGTFAWQVEAAPTQVSVGDPITIKIRVEGKGNIEALTFPPQPGWREFKIYPGNSHVDMLDQLGVEGTKIFEQVISPLNAGVKEIPRFSFSFFDPEQNTYRTLTHDPIPLQVRTGAATPQPTVVSANAPPASENPQQAREIVHIKAALGTLRISETPLITRPAFLVMQAAAPLLWLGAMAYRRKKEQFDNNPRLRRQKAVDKIIAEGVEKLKAQAAANQSDEFFATLFHLLQEQIGERLDVPASGITESVLDHELKNRATPETITRLRELFDLCNQARYAPVRGSQQLAALIPKLEQALAELRQMKNESTLAKA